MKYIFSNKINKNYVKNILTKARSLWRKEQLLNNKVIGPTSVYRMIFNDSPSRKDKIIRDMLLDSLISCERQVPGSSIYFSELLSEINEVKDSGRLGIEQIKNEVLSIPLKEISREIYKNVIDVMGPETKVVVKKSPRSKTIIELSSGFKISIGMDPVFYKNIPEDSINISDVEIILIEGSPDSIGEINYILERSHNEKRNILLICRSFSEEIVATLSTNWMRDSLRIIPAVYGNNIDNINLPPDLCEITGTFPITPKFGDSISVAISKKEKYGYAKNISINDIECTLQSDKNVDNYRAALSERMALEKDKEKQKILSDRISSLASELITVLVPEKDEVVFEELDAMFKIHSQFCQSGYAEISNKKIPISIWKCVIEHKVLYTKLLNSIGGILLIDD